MPHLIVSTVALLSNLYKNAPLIVGDKDSDPDLMRFLGARITTNYPACGSPPMYVMHAPPRTVFDNLEKRGYCLMSAQTIQEHSVWILARPRVPDDDKVEISRGGPNDKSIQAFDDPGTTETPAPGISKQRSPTNTPRLTVTRTPSKRSLKEAEQLISSYEKNSSLADERSLLHKSSFMENQSNIIYDLFNNEFRESSLGGKSSHRSSKKIVENHKLSAQILENEPRRKPSHRIRKPLETDDSRSRSVSPDKRVPRDISPKNHGLTLQMVEKEQTRKQSHKTRKALGSEDTRSRSVSPDKKVPREISPSNQKLNVQVRGNSPMRTGTSVKEKQALFENEASHSGSASSKKRYDTGQEDSQTILAPNKKDPGNVTSKGDAGTYWLGNEKVHMGIQASDSELSLKKHSDVMSRVTFHPRKHSELLKESDDLIKDNSQSEAIKKKSALKHNERSMQQTQVDFEFGSQIKPHKAGISVHFANSNEELDIEKSPMLNSNIHELTGIIDLNCLQRENTHQYTGSSEGDQGSHILNVEESTTIKETSVMEDSVILKSLASRCSHIAIVDDVSSPMFIDITDPTHLTCLTRENCCCEDS